MISEEVKIGEEPKTNSVDISSNRAGRILAAALGLGWAFDLLFFGHWPGLSVGLFVLLVVASLAVLGKMEGAEPRRHALWIVVPLLFFAGMVAVRANPLLVVLNVMACLVLLALLAYFYSAGRLDRLGIVGYYLALFLSTFNVFFRAAPLIPQGINVSSWRTQSRKSTRTLMPVLRGLLIALPIAAVFTVLLASADTVFASWVGSLLNITLPDISEALWHIVLVLMVAWLAAGGLAFALSRRGKEDREPWEEVLDGVPRTIHIGFIEGAIVLMTVNLIFMAFGWIQFSYLFGGTANIEAGGITYADYARRGFFELVAVGVLTMGLILGLHHFTWRETKLQGLLFRVMATSMVACTGVLLASAFYRMWLYEEAYGFTHLRLIVHVFEVWLALLFVWLVVSLWVWPRHFAIGGFVAIVGFLATLNVMNIDAAIADRNIERYAATGKIDIYYLSRLSDDAVPSLLEHADRLPAEDRNWLLYRLNERRQAMASDTAWRSIPSLNLGRWQAYEALEANRDALMQAPLPDFSQSGNETYDGWDR